MEVSEDQPFEELHRIGQPKSVSEDLGLLRKIRRELFTLSTVSFWDGGGPMHSMKRQVLSSSSAMLVAATGLVLGLRRLLTELTERALRQCATLQAEQSFQRSPLRWS
jgi:hypothetical protein